MMCSGGAMKRSEEGLQEHQQENESCDKCVVGVEQQRRFRNNNKTFEIGSSDECDKICVSIITGAC